jgi:hypothetical protein
MNTKILIVINLETESVVAKNVWISAKGLIFFVVTAAAVVIGIFNIVAVIDIIIMIVRNSVCGLD